MRKKSAVVLSALSIVFLFVAIAFYDSSRPEATESENSLKNIAGPKYLKLPDLQIEDWTGNALNLRDFRNKFVYIHFFDPRYEHDRRFFYRAYQEWGDQPVAFLLCTEYPEKTIELFPGLNRVYIISRFEKLNNLFESVEKTSFCFFYGLDLSYRFHTVTYTPYEYAMHYELSKEILGKYFNIQALLGRNINIRDNVLLEPITKSIPRNGKKISLVFLKTICDGCKSGMIAKEIIAQYKRNNTEARIVLYDSFGRNDIGNLQRQLGAEVPIYLAADGILDKWKQVGIEYSESETETMVIISSSDGAAEYFYSPGCRCEGRIPDMFVK